MVILILLICICDSQKELRMLVLSRKRDQSIMIGEYEVRVVEIRGDKVRLSIDAPPDVPVHRREVYKAIRRENGGSEQQ